MQRSLLIEIGIKPNVIVNKEGYDCLFISFHCIYLFKVDCEDHFWRPGFLHITIAGFTLANLETSLKVSTVIISFDKCKIAVFTLEN